MQGLKLRKKVEIKIKDMFSQGYKASYIAETLNISRATVYNKLSKDEKRAYNWH